MATEKIIHNTDIKFEPNSTYLLSKPGNKYIRIITDSLGNPAYPYSENSEIGFELSQSPDGDSSEKINEKSNTIVGYKPHIDFKDLGDGRIMVKMSDNIMLAIANSYKKISSPNPNRKYALGLDGKPVELDIYLNERLIVGEDGVLKGREKVLNIPKGIKKIADNAFHSQDLNNVLIPTTMEEIGHNAFSENNIELITLPAFCKYYRDSFDSTVIITGGKIIS